jgi:hypothetical protein
MCVIMMLYNLLGSWQDVMVVFRMFDSARARGGGQLMEPRLAGAWVF